MAFSKEKYWEEKPNNIGSKRPKTQAVPPQDAEIAFNNNGMYVKNRAFKRKQMHSHSNLFTRKGYIPSLNAIRIKRRKSNNKVVQKYVKIDESIIE